jgi:hypothetical protein
LTLTLSSREQKILNAIGCTDLHLNAASDPVDMAALVQTLVDIEFRDEGGKILCREVLAAGLRKQLFDVDLATDDLERATAPDPCPTSIAGQWQLCWRLRRWDYQDSTDHDRPQMEEYVEALKILSLKDKRGRPFCDEVIATAVRSAFYDPLKAADRLIIVADLLHRRARYSNLEAKRSAYQTLRKRFTGVYRYSDAREPQPWHAAVGEPIPVVPEYGPWQR